MGQSNNEPSHPPYGVTQPRQLIRWEDVNPQGGRLTRTRGQIKFYFKQFPNGNWDGNQTFVVLDFPFRLSSYHMTVTNNFSILQDNLFQQVINNIPAGFCFCVAFVLDNGTVVRFKLTNGPDSEVNNTPRYNGEVILPNCMFEIWSSGNAGDVLNYGDLPDVALFNTSICGSKDYRWSTDFLVNTMIASLRAFDLNGNPTDYGLVPTPGFSFYQFPIPFQSQNRVQTNKTNLY